MLGVLHLVVAVGTLSSFKAKGSANAPRPEARIYAAAMAPATQRSLLVPHGWHSTSETTHKT
jgi:hypothetical protein